MATTASGGANAGQRHAAQARLIGFDQGRTAGEGETDRETGEAADHRRRVAQREAEGKAPAGGGWPNPSRRELFAKPSGTAGMGANAIQATQF